MTKNKNRFPPKPKPAFLKGPPERYWLYGKHACMAAIENPERNYFQILVTKNTLNDLPHLHDHRKVVETHQKDISKVLPKDAVHQGIAVEVAPLEEKTLANMPMGKHVVVLDQVTDPHNIGAIIRSAAAFDIGAVITTLRHAPHETAILAKTASGAFETIPLIKVTNLSQCLETLKEQGYHTAGLAGEATESVQSLDISRPTALVMGAEGKGLRLKTRTTCDTLVHIPMSDAMESLNVSNAAAICFYALFSQ